MEIYDLKNNCYFIILPNKKSYILKDNEFTYYKNLEYQAIAIKGKIKSLRKEN